MALKLQNRFRESRHRRESKVPLFQNFVTLESNPYPHPYMDSASWLYMDANPLIQIDAPVMHPQNLEYAMPPPRRKANCCKHNHHHHRHHSHRHDQQCHHRHRRVVSDPGANNWNILNSADVKRHRRVSSFNQPNDICLQETISERNHDDLMTSTFRKVPWHPNLHMLKIRRT